ncbi:hypothetical protein AQUCO_00700458v1 [Aquilegia coerulea]|uniref:Dof zinc finger protein n=1 Tax=Aquilegia coerulea TaxID=218851 RepID=A0A2G5EK31_AQUCA|nr:hypothetical protein AQUCO_00700458v1 [Aquilegia coerulea]
MIQELFSGSSASLLGGERKFPFSGVVLEGSPSSSSPSLSTSSTNTTNTTSTTANNNTPTTDQQNLRCPRCDSSNTKFCYYNNYNLTQPRHFCKTCRRYWTKGGALRNVPIGGGCRKNKTTIAPATTAVKSNTAKIKTGSTEFGKTTFGFDLELPSNPIVWTSPQNNQLMTLLRAAQMQNPNPNPNPVTIKEEGSMIGSYNMCADTNSNSAIGTSALNATPIGVDPLSQIPVGLCNSFWKNNQHQQYQQPQHQQLQQQQQQQHNFLMSDVQAATGIQELFQRLRSSGNYYSDHSSSQLNNNNVANTSSSNPSTITMDPSPITGAEVGFWNNPSFVWSNLSASNGAFP